MLALPSSLGRNEATTVKGHGVVPTASGVFRFASRSRRCSRKTFSRAAFCSSVSGCAVARIFRTCCLMVSVAQCWRLAAAAISIHSSSIVGVSKRQAAPTPGGQPALDEDLRSD